MNHAKYYSRLHVLCKCHTINKNNVFPGQIKLSATTGNSQCIQNWEYLLGSISFLPLFFCSSLVKITNDCVFQVIQTPVTLGDCFKNSIILYCILGSTSVKRSTAVNNVSVSLIFRVNNKISYYIFWQ